MGLIFGCDHCMARLLTILNCFIFFKNSLVSHLKELHSVINEEALKILVNSSKTIQIGNKNKTHQHHHHQHHHTTTPTSTKHGEASASQGWWCLLFYRN